MRKEPIIAIIIGSLVGLGVAFFVWQYTNSIGSNTSPETTNNQQENSESNNSRKSASTTTTEGGISLVSPAELAVFDESPVIVSGIAPGNSIVAIATNKDITLINAEANGEFSAEIELSGGYETIKVWGFSDDVQSTTSVNVVYSRQLASEDGEEEKEIRTRTAMLGSVTDISENTIQIKTTDDLIEQLSVSDTTTYSNIVSEPEDTEFSEIAIGDFIIALGSKANNILETERILVSEQPSKNGLVAVFGQIVELSSSEFIVTHADGEDYSIDATGKINVTKFDENGEFVRARLSESSDGERIIIIGDLEEEVIASRIHIFPIQEAE